MQWPDFPGILAVNQPVSGTLAQEFNCCRSKAMRAPEIGLITGY